MPTDESKNIEVSGDILSERSHSFCMRARRQGKISTFRSAHGGPVTTEQRVGNKSVQFNVLVEILAALDSNEDAMGAITSDHVAICGAHVSFGFPWKERQSANTIILQRASRVIGINLAQTYEQGSVALQGRRAGTIEAHRSIVYD
jgi:hypothetical protein